MDFTFGDPAVEINKTVKAVDGKNTWNDIDETSSFTYTEQFACSSQGRTNVVDLLGDNPSTPQVETNYKLDTDSASVTVRCSETPPPPPPPTVKTDEFMDVQVVKDATPQVQLVNGQADIAYTVRVRNNGPNQAHDVKLVDAAPSGVTFTGITQQPVNGSCSLSGGVLLQCSLGTLGPGRRAGDRALGPRHPDGDVRQLRDGHGRRQGHERREQHGVRVDAGHRSGDAADDDSEAAGHEAEAEARS